MSRQQPVCGFNASSETSRRVGNPAGAAGAHAKQIEDGQASVMRLDDKVLVASSSPKLFPAPSTPQQRLGNLTRNEAGDLSSPVANRISDNGANLTSVGLAVLPSPTRGDKLRDTRVWVASLEGGPTPTPSPPASRTDPAVPPGDAAASGFPSLPLQLQPGRHSALHRRSVGGGPPKPTCPLSPARQPQPPAPQALASPAPPPAAAPPAAASAACGAEAMEPTGGRRGSHRSSFNEASFPDAASSSAGVVLTAAPAAAAAPLGPGPYTRVSSAATTTTSLGLPDTSGCATAWVDVLLLNSCTTTASAAAGASGRAPAKAVPPTVPATVPAGSGGSWTSGEGDEENAPLLSAYVAAMPSAGSAPANEDIRNACKRQRSASDGLWHPPPPARLLVHANGSNPSGAPHLPPAAVAAAVAAAAAAAALGMAAAPPPPAAAATTAASPPGLIPQEVLSGGGGGGGAPGGPSSTPTLPSALSQRRATAQQAGYYPTAQTYPHSNPYQPHHHHNHHQPPPLQPPQKPRRQSLDSYRLPLVAVNHAAGGAAATASTPVATTATNSPALSDRAGIGASSCRVVATPSLVRDVQRFADVSDLSDAASDVSGDSDHGGVSLRLPPLQPSVSTHLKVLRASVDGDPGPRPRQAGHSFFTDSHDEFDGWVQHPPHVLGGGGGGGVVGGSAGPANRGVPTWLRNQPPFLQCRSGPAAGGSGADGASGGGAGGGGDGGGGSGAGLSLQMRASSYNSAVGRTPAAVAAAASSSGEVYGGALLSPPSLRPGGSMQPITPTSPAHSQQQQQLPAPLSADAALSPAYLYTASCFASGAAAAAVAAPGGAGGGGGGGGSATTAPLSPPSLLSPSGSTGTAAGGPPRGAPHQAWGAAPPAAATQAPSSPGLPLLPSPRSPATTGSGGPPSPPPPPPPLTTPVCGGAVPALQQSAPLVYQMSVPQPQSQQSPVPPQPQPPLPEQQKRQPQQPQQPQKPLQHVLAPKSVAPPPQQAQSALAVDAGGLDSLLGQLTDMLGLSIASADGGGGGAASISAAPVRRRQPVPPPLPPGSRSRRGLLAAVTEEPAAVTTFNELGDAAATR